MVGNGGTATHLRLRVRSKTAIVHRLWKIKGESRAGRVMGSADLGRLAVFALDVDRLFDTSRWTWSVEYRIYWCGVFLEYTSQKAEFWAGYHWIAFLNCFSRWPRMDPPKSHWTSLATVYLRCWLFEDQIVKLIVLNRKSHITPEIIPQIRIMGGGIIHSLQKSRATKKVIYSLKN